MLSKEEIEEAKEELKIIWKETDFENSKRRVAIATLLQYIDQLEQENKKQNKMIDEMIEILNQWMPLAECAYWNYAKHTCSHTCRGCNSLSKYNRRTDSGILIDDDRYCRLYENGNAEEDTVFVKIEDLMLRHNIKSFFEKKVEEK